MREIKILPIYEENLIGFYYDGTNAQIKYHHEDAEIVLSFNIVYLFDFCEFDYINDVYWSGFGLFEYDESPLLSDLIARSWHGKDIAFGGEIEKIRHYKLVIDDVGIYNIVCKQFLKEVIT